MNRTAELVHGPKRMLEQIRLSPGVVPQKLSNVIRVVVGRQQNDADLRVGFAYTLRRGYSIDARHLHVHDDDAEGYQLTRADAGARAFRRLRQVLSASGLV